MGKSENGNETSLNQFCPKTGADSNAISPDISSDFFRIWGKNGESLTEATDTVHVDYSSSALKSERDQTQEEMHFQTESGNARLAQSEIRHRAKV